MERYDPLLHDDAIEALRILRGKDRQAIRGFLDKLWSNPHMIPDTTYTDRKGRMVSKVRVHRHMVDYIVDDAIREIKVLRIIKLA